MATELGTFVVPMTLEAPAGDLGPTDAAWALTLDAWRLLGACEAALELTGLARKFGTMGYVYSLMSPSHMLTSTIEAHMNSTSLLGARHGFAVGPMEAVLVLDLKDPPPWINEPGGHEVFGHLKLDISKHEGIDRGRVRAADETGNAFGIELQQARVGEDACAAVVPSILTSASISAVPA